MEYKQVDMVVDNVTFKVLNAIGDGQCQCPECLKSGKPSIYWTPWMYRKDMESPLLCSDCIKNYLRHK